MTLQILLGDTIITAILFWISLAGICSLFFVTVFTIIYQRVIYPRWIISSFDPSYRPRCSVILPCKGLPQGFEQNIQSFLELDYEKYEVIFCVESDDDPAVPIINKLVEKDSRASLVVAGLSTQCSQKNYNMIAAVNRADNPDVYVFADSDIQPDKKWINDIVRPLSREDITASTGFRWLYSSKGSLGELANVYQNIIVYVLFTFVSFTRNFGLWGGTMAIRKEAFENLGVSEYWGETVVDDMSLSQIIMKKSKKSVLTANCIVPTEDALPTIGKSILWFERQIMFLKSYQKPQWYLAIIIVLMILFYLIWLPGALFLGLFTSHTFVGLGGASSMVVVFGTMAMTLFYPLMGKQPHFIRLILFQPLFLLTILIGILRTVFTNTVSWSGILYKMNYKGKVVSVKR